ncbi:MAG: DNA repair exonuclease [Elusimicrobiaceae bacterium]
MIRFIHTSDLHLTDPRKPEGAHRLEVLREICALARKHDALVISGDLFDSAGEAEFLHEAVKTILTEINPVPVLVIPGNHDFLRGENPFDGRYDLGQSVNVRLLTQAPFDVFRLDKFVLYGFPFQPSLTTADLFRTLPPLAGEKRIAILHGTPSAMEALAGFAARPENAEEGGDFIIKEQDLRMSGFIYAALGHIHKPAQWQSGDAFLSYCGTPDAVRITEEESGFVNSVTVTAEGKASVERLAVKNALAAARKQFLVFPGDEDELFEKINAFVSEVKDRCRPGVIIDGIADLNRVQDTALRVSSKWKALPCPVHFKIRAEQTGENAKDMMLCTFLRRIQTQAADNPSPARRDTLRRMLVLGWRTMTGKTIDPEDLLEQTK